MGFLIYLSMKIRLMLDSGAYSAWKRGEEINIYDYIDYIKRNLDWIEQYVNLDVIPGKPGSSPTQEDVENSAKQSYKNLQIMKDAGLHPLPVFHQDERFYWLERLLDDGEDYIGLSPQEDMIGWLGKPPHEWLDKSFTFVTDEEGNPFVKTHGFGVTKIQLLKRYPWTTCDSTSWTMLANFGKIYCPVYRKERADYLRDPPLVVHVSERTKRIGNGWGDAKSKTKEQYGHLSRIEQDFVRRFVEVECGLSMTDVKYDDCARRVCLIKFFQNLSRDIGEVIFKHRVKK